MERITKIGVMALVALVLGWAVWSAVTHDAQAERCRRSLSGVAVRAATSDQVVCLRADVVLKTY